MRIKRPVLILMDGEHDNIVPKNSSINEFLQLQQDTKGEAIVVYAGPRSCDNVDIVRKNPLQVFACSEDDTGNMVTLFFTGDKAERLWNVLLKEYTPYKADEKYTDRFSKK